MLIPFPPRALHNFLFFVELHVFLHRVAFNQTGAQVFTILLHKKDFILCFDSVASRNEKNKISIAFTSEILDFIERYIHILLVGDTIANIKKFHYECRRLHKQVMISLHKLNQPSITMMLLENTMILIKYFSIHNTPPLQDSDEMIEMFNKWIKTFLRDHNNHDDNWEPRILDWFEIGHLLAYAYYLVKFKNVDNRQNSNNKQVPKLKESAYEPMNLDGFSPITKRIILELRDQRSKNTAQQIKQVETVQRFYKEKLSDEVLKIYKELALEMEEAAYVVEDNEEEKVKSNANSKAKSAKKSKRRRTNKNRNKTDSESEESENERIIVSM